MQFKLCRFDSMVESDEAIVLSGPKARYLGYIQFGVSIDARAPNVLIFRKSRQFWSAYVVYNRYVSVHCTCHKYEFQRLDTLDEIIAYIRCHADTIDRPALLASVFVYRAEQFTQQQSQSQRMFKRISDGATQS
jgi:hypothetical protein